MAIFGRRRRKRQQPATQPPAKKSGPRDWQFETGERILVYFGKLLYRSTVLDRQIAEDGYPEYLIKYDGFRSIHNEWVDDTRVLERNRQNLNFMKENHKLANERAKLEKLAKAEKKMKKRQTSTKQNGIITKKVQSTRKMSITSKLETRIKKRKRPTKKSSERADNNSMTTTEPARKRRGRPPLKRPSTSNDEKSQPTRKRSKSVKSNMVAPTVHKNNIIETERYLRVSVIDFMKCTPTHPDIQKYLLRANALQKAPGTSNVKITETIEDNSTSPNHTANTTECINNSAIANLTKITLKEQGAPSQILRTTPKTQSITVENGSNLHATRANDEEDIGTFTNDLPITRTIDKEATCSASDSVSEAEVNSEDSCSSVDFCPVSESNKDEDGCASIDSLPAATETNGEASCSVSDSVSAAKTNSEVSCSSIDFCPVAVSGNEKHVYSSIDSLSETGENGGEEICSSLKNSPRMEKIDERDSGTSTNNLPVTSSTDEENKWAFMSSSTAAGENEEDDTRTFTNDLPTTETIDEEVISSSSNNLPRTINSEDNTIILPPRLWHRDKEFRYIYRDYDSSTPDTTDEENSNASESTWSATYGEEDNLISALGNEDYISSSSRDSSTIGTSDDESSCASIDSFPPAIETIEEVSCSASDSASEAEINSEDSHLSVDFRPVAESDNKEDGRASIDSLPAATEINGEASCSASDSASEAEINSEDSHLSVDFRPVAESDNKEDGRASIDSLPAATEINGEASCSASDSVSVAKSNSEASCSSTDICHAIKADEKENGPPSYYRWPKIKLNGEEDFSECSNNYSPSPEIFNREHVLSVSSILRNTLSFIREFGEDRNQYRLPPQFTTDDFTWNYSPPNNFLALRDNPNRDGYMPIEIPQILKDRLSEDFVMIQDRDKVLRFPEIFKTVAHVLRAYVDSKPTIRIKKKSFEFVVVLLNYFNQVVYDQFMYPNELEMCIRNKGMHHFLDKYQANSNLRNAFIFEDVLSPKRVWCHLLGITHLLRIFEYIPCDIADLVSTRRRIENITVDDFHDLLNYLEANFAQIFSSEKYAHSYDDLKPGDLASRIAQSMIFPITYMVYEKVKSSSELDEDFEFEDS